MVRLSKAVLKRDSIMTYYSMEYDSLVGKITLVCDDDNLVGLWLEGQKYSDDTACKLIESPSHDILIMSKNWLDDYFAGKKPEISDLPLAPIGSKFRQEVWKTLMEIPYGEVITYGRIAKELIERTGVKNMSSQAVGGAVGHNPISIIIPCHRVVGSNGSLTGYPGGLEKKIKLLQHEGIDTSKFSIPKTGTAL